MGDPSVAADTTMDTPTDDGAPMDVDAQKDAGACVDGDPFAVANLRKDLKYLASKELDGRKPGTPGDVAARKYIEKRFRCLGLVPGGTDGSYFQAVTNTKGEKTANVIALLPGSDPDVGSEIVGMGAHMDHFGNGRLGANDNASGTTTVLAAAQAFKQLAKPPKRTIAFFLWASEEVSYDGSVHFVKHPTEIKRLPLSKFVYYINFDMVGSYTSNGKEVDACGTVGTTPALPLMRDLLPSQHGLNVNIEIPGYGSDDSDYYPFCKAGVPFVGFEMDDPPCYHKKCDTEDRIDYPNMVRVSKLATDLVRQLADTTTDLAEYRRKAKVSDLGCGKDDD